MKHCRYEHIKSDAKECKDGEIFTAYRESSQTWAFAMRINNNFTLTRFQSYNVDKEGVKAVQKQIMFCKKYGWSYSGYKAFDDDSFCEKPKFLCLYCKQETFDTSEPCLCRNTKIEDLMKKTPSGLILPY